MNLHDYIRIVRRGWWVIALCTILGALVALAFARATPPTYRVTATVYVSNAGTGTVAERQAGVAFALQRAQSYADLASTSTVLQRAVEELGDGTTLEDLRRSIEPVVQTGTSLIDINGSGSDPDQVAARVNSVAQALSAEVPRLEAAIEPEEPTPRGAVPPADSPVVVSVVGVADVPEVAVTPQPRYNTIVGAVVGFALGLAGLIVAHSLDTRIRTLSDLPRSSALSTRTVIPGSQPRGFRRRGDGGEARAEGFRTLRANLRFGTNVGGSITVTGVDTSADARAVTRQLATALGEVGSRVVVVDVDFRRSPSSPDAVPSEPGVADVLRGTVTAARATTGTDEENVFSIPAGNTDGNAAQLLSMQQMTDLLDELESDYAYVLLACPPVTERSESTVLAALTDTTLVVVEAGSTRRSAFMHAMELLAGVRASSISVVLENVREPEVAVRGRSPESSLV